MLVGFLITGTLFVTYVTFPVIAIVRNNIPLWLLSKSVKSFYITGKSFFSYTKPHALLS